MKRKMLITGGQGMLASDCARLAGEHGYDVTALSHAQLDVADPVAVCQILESLKPHVVINTVGIGVDLCELNPTEGYRVHAWAGEVLARYCDVVGATFMFISSCGLFGDEIRAYSEYDPVVLKTKYARTKYLGELAAQRQCRRVFVVRCGWLFGGTQGHQRNFVYQRFKEAQQKLVVRSAGDKFGSPTHTGDLASKMFELLETEAYGIYHISNSGGCSRCDYTTYIIKSFGLDTPVEETDSAAFSRPAPTPNSEMLENLNLRFLGLKLLDPWEESIGRYVATLRKEIGV